ncbi:hypothetical protein [uncultured Flavobacterium sp.]|uniref:hypothetical protein n=1 Tax=uncultured Flavobacterium sp. TaxID=165435 RepID=UPI0025FA91F1|nr:hypothetical protein [uncultured Flavobacterium sp.]
MKKTINCAAFFGLLFSFAGLNAQNTATTSGNWDNCTTWGNPSSIIQNQTDTKTINTGINVIQNTTWSTKTIDFSTGNGSVSFTDNTKSIDFVTDLGPDKSCCIAPTITTQPVSGTTTGVSNYTFSVVATGTGLTYQWRRNGTNISGATNSSYSTNVVATYSVVVTGTCGNVTSRNITLTNPCAVGSISSYTASGPSHSNPNGSSSTYNVSNSGTNTDAVSWSGSQFTLNCNGTYTVEGDVTMNGNIMPAGDPTSVRLSGYGYVTASAGTRHFSITVTVTNAPKTLYFWQFVSLGSTMSFSIANGKITKNN